MGPEIMLSIRKSYHTHVFHFKNGELAGLVTVELEPQRARAGWGPRARVDDSKRGIRYLLFVHTLICM